MPPEAQAVLDSLADLIASRQKSNQSIQPYGYGQKHDASGTPISVGYSHGPGGLLTFPGVDPAVFNAMMGFNSILSRLPATGSVYTNPTFMTITGVGDDTGEEKDSVCDDAPTAGLMAGCMLTSVFGRYERATPELELNRLGQRNDRADPLDLTLIGSPLSGANPFAGGQQNVQTPADLFTNEVSRKFWERNVSLHRLLSLQLWRGNPSNNAALSPGGGYKEMTGFSVLVNTGHRDAETGDVCRNMDSYISDFNYVQATADGGNLIGAVTNIWYQVNRRADLTGMQPVRWMFAMRSQMFYELTRVWPCAYLSYRCNPLGTAVEFIDSSAYIEMRDAMYNGKYLLIDGQRVEVVLDDAMPELSGDDSGGHFPAGCFSSDIYLIPMSVKGGRAVTYLEYFEYNNPSLTDALGNMILGRIEGAFLTWPRQTNQCIVWQTKIEPRLIMRVPWLAARLKNVVYCPIQHEPEAFPGDPYFVNDGRTSRPGPSFYSIWQS